MVLGGKDVVTECTREGLRRQRGLFDLLGKGVGEASNLPKSSDLFFSEIPSLEGEKVHKIISFNSGRNAPVVVGEGKRGRGPFLLTPRGATSFSLSFLRR